MKEEERKNKSMEAWVFTLKKQPKQTNKQTKNQKKTEGKVKKRDENRTKEAMQRQPFTTL